MSCGEQQKQEIATIKERIVKLQLSDADCERIAKKAGSAGVTVAELLENFIGDLIGGTYSNGSDERGFANNWFERCFDCCRIKNSEDTLLEYFINMGQSVEDFLDILDDIQRAEEDLKLYKERPQDYDEEEMSYVEGDLQSWKEEYHNAICEWIKTHKNVNMEKEIELCRKWLADFESLKGEE